MDTLAKGQVEAAYKQLFPMILAKCTRMLHDAEEANDVAQETFTRLWAKRRTIRDGQMVTSWLYRTSIRLAIDRLRLRVRQQPADLAEGIAPADTGHGLEDQVAARQAILRLCSRAPKRELEAAILSGIDGLTHPEIAEVMGKSERTVRRLLAKFQRRHPETPSRSR